MKFDKKFYWWEKVDVVNDNKMIQNFCLILSFTKYLFQKICLMSCNFTHKGYKKFNLYSSLLKIKICICMKKCYQRLEREVDWIKIVLKQNIFTIGIKLGSFHVTQFY